MSFKKENRHLRNYLFLSALLFLLSSFSPAVCAQTDTPANYTQRKIAFIPSNVDKVNGLAIGVWPQNLKSDSAYLKVNGVTVQVNLILLCFGYIRGAFTIKEIDSFEYYTFQRTSPFDRSNMDGVVLNIPGHLQYNTTIRGISLSALTFCTGEIHGVSISGLTNCSYVVKGVSICGGYNSGNKVRGIQIGLVNRATNLHGVQIGLWNKNGRRSLPFINWQFRD